MVLVEYFPNFLQFRDILLASIQENDLKAFNSDIKHKKKIPLRDIETDNPKVSYNAIYLNTTKPLLHTGVYYFKRCLLFITISKSQYPLNFLLLSKELLPHYTVHSQNSELFARYNVYLIFLMYNFLMLYVMLHIKVSFSIERRHKWIN